MSRVKSPIGTINERKRLDGTICLMEKTADGWRYIKKKSMPGYMNPQKTGRKKYVRKRDDPNYLDPRTIKTGRTISKRAAMKRPERTNIPADRVGKQVTNNHCNPDKVIISALKKYPVRWVQTDSRTWREQRLF